MPLHWNSWATLQAVQLDYEKTPTARPVRLAAPVPGVGDPVRIGVSGIEIEGRISRVAGAVLHVKVKAAPLRARAARRVKSA